MYFNSLNTCNSLATYPASTAARLAPIAALSLSQSGWMTLSKFSELPRDRPPDTMVEAEDNFGLSSSDLDSPTHSVPVDHLGGGYYYNLTRLFY